jgi:hypothetical protein
VQISYRRLPDREKTFRQEILHDGPNCKFSLLIHPEGEEPLNVGEIKLEPGGALLWYLFPERPYEVAGVYDPDGEFLGWYTNLLRPPEIEGDRWVLTDLYLERERGAGRRRSSGVTPWRPSNHSDCTVTILRDTRRTW